MIGVDVLAILVAVGYTASLLVLTVYGLHWGWWAWMRRQYAVTDAAAPSSWPAVTVQIPLYNEPEVAARVIDACAQLDYPADRLHIQVLDDSTDSTSAQVAERVAYWRQQDRSIAHIQRDHRAGYKAGALAHGLNRTEAPLVAIFDADFVPPANFLRAMVPHLADPEVGMVQARWAHRNTRSNWCTWCQAVGLNAHFGLEQAGRHAGAFFMHFNGTAGVWKRRCIEEAGGWQSDTLTEDLDLSYRAQLAGWKLVYIDDVAVPADLPGTVAAWRTQQFRWTKGAIETARKLLGALWRSDERVRAKVAGSLHLLAHLAFPAIIGAALLHAPFLVAAAYSNAIPSALLHGLTAGVVGFLAFAWAVWVAQRAAGWSVGDIVRGLPAFFLGSMGLAVNNTKAVYAALRRRTIPFRRTPKGAQTRAVHATSLTTRAAEALLGGYCALGVGALWMHQVWIALPFQAALAASFLLMAFTDWWQHAKKRQAGMSRPDGIHLDAEQNGVGPATPGYDDVAARRCEEDANPV